MLERHKFYWQQTPQYCHYFLMVCTNVYVPIKTKIVLDNLSKKKGFFYFNISLLALFSVNDFRKQILTLFISTRRWKCEMHKRRISNGSYVWIKENKFLMVKDILNSCKNKDFQDNGNLCFLPNISPTLRLSVTLFCVFSVL